MILNISFVLLFWLTNLVAKTYHLTTGTDVIKRIMFVLSNFSFVFKRPLPSLAPTDLLVGVIAAGGLKLLVYLRGKKKKVYRDGEEHGSARFGTTADILPFMDTKNVSNNIILSQTERLTMGKPSLPKYGRNKNVLVVGGSGSGKTRFWLKPNLMNMVGSYVVSDPKGTLILECGKLLKDNGYDIKVVNTINFDKSMHYNPFSYLHSEKDVLMLVNTLVANTKGEGDKSGEDFWVKAEKMLLTALIAYERQGIDQIPTVHLGVAASAVEKRGISTERGNINREIEVSNQKLRQIKARISKLQDWLKAEAENIKPPTLADAIQNILSRRDQTGQPSHYGSVHGLKAAADMLNFLTVNNIMDMEGLDDKFKSMIGEQYDIRDKLKPIERRLPVLKKHIEQSNIYLKFKGNKALTDSENILFTAAKNYLTDIMNGKPTLPTKSWKVEFNKLVTERNNLNKRYVLLKDEVKEAERIRSSVYDILKQEQRLQQPQKKQDMDL